MANPNSTDERAFERSQSVGHEVRDVNPRGVVIAGIGLLVLVAISMSLMYWFAITVAGSPYDELEVREPQRVPMHQEQFQANQHLLRRRQEAERRRILDSYTWLDEGRVARIPIDRAIETLVARGSLAPLSPGVANQEEENQEENQEGQTQENGTQEQPTNSAEGAS